MSIPRLALVITHSGTRNDGYDQLSFSAEHV